MHILQRLSATLVALVLSQLSFAQEAVSETSKLSGSAHLAQVFIALVLVLLLILALGWLLKRVSQTQAMGGKQIKLVAHLPLGNRERIALIDVAGQQLVVGITPQNIQTLHTFDEPVVDINQQKVKPSEFSQRLKSFLQNPATDNAASNEPQKEPS